jgi:hypothetical protein
MEEGLQLVSTWSENHFSAASLKVGITFPSAPGRLYSLFRRIFPRAFANAFASFSLVNVLNFRRPFLKDPTRYFVIVYGVPSSLAFSVCSSVIQGMVHPSFRLV